MEDGRGQIQLDHDRQGSHLNYRQSSKQDAVVRFPFLEAKKKIISTHVLISILGKSLCLRGIK